MPSTKLNGDRQIHVSDPNWLRLKARFDLQCCFYFAYDLNRRLTNFNEKKC